MLMMSQVVVDSISSTGSQACSASSTMRVQDDNIPKGILDCMSTMNDNLGEEMTPKMQYENELNRCIHPTVRKMTK